MDILQIPLPDQSRFGFTHKFTIDTDDLVALGASTTGTITLMSFVAGQGVTKAAFRLETALDGTSITNVALDVGYDVSSGTDDPDGILDNYEIAGAATEILYGDGNGAVFATLRTGFYPQVTGSYTALFTATGANLSAMTAGKVHIYLRIEDLNKL